MMHGGMGSGKMDWNRGQQSNLQFSVNDVNAYLECWVARMGNPRLKARRFVEKAANTITADSVTIEQDVLVQRSSVDRRTGTWQAIQ